MLLGCIGDDFTGSSDLGNTLAKQGMRVVQYTGVPDHPADPAVQAGIVSLKTRSVPVKDAVEQSLAALAWLRAQGCQQFLFKYCSTFDSTPTGNIGPVLDALADALEAESVIVCPVFPGTGRTLYQGHLFVNDLLLNESGMQFHPLTPMTDPDIRRWLGHQTQHPVDHIDIATVRAGGVKSALAAGQTQGRRMVVVDALEDADLHTIGKAAAALPLISGGSGIALGLPANFGISAPSGGQLWAGVAGKLVALSGSCSKATLEQVAVHQRSNPSMKVEAADVLSGKTTPQDIVQFLLAGEGTPLAYSSLPPQDLKMVQDQFGTDTVANAIEACFRQVAAQLSTSGVGGIISAGGETSGAVVQGTGVTDLEIGPEIDPGVPLLRTASGLALTLKSGNFGAPDFFAKAADRMRGS